MNYGSLKKWEKKWGFFIFRIHFLSLHFICYFPFLNERGEIGTVRSCANAKASTCFLFSDSAVLQISRHFHRSFQPVFPRSVSLLPSLILLTLIIACIIYSPIRISAVSVCVCTALQCTAVRVCVYYTYLATLHKHICVLVPLPGLCFSVSIISALPCCLWCFGMNARDARVRRGAFLPLGDPTFGY